MGHEREIGPCITLGHLLNSDIEEKHFDLENGVTNSSRELHSVQYGNLLFAHCFVTHLLLGGSEVTTFHVSRQRQ